MRRTRFHRFDRFALGVRDDGAQGDESSSSSSSSSSMSSSSTETYIQTTVVDFDGSNDYVTYGNNYEQDWVTVPWSFGMWLNFSSIVTGTKNLASKITHTTTPRDGWWLLENNGTLFFEIYVNDATAGNGLKRSRAGLTSGWHFVAITYDGSNDNSGMQIYIDGSGSSTSVQNISGSYNAVTEDLRIGISSQGSFPTLFKSTDWVLAANDQWSASEVTELYNSGTPYDIDTDFTASAKVALWGTATGSTYPTITSRIGATDGTMTNMAADDLVTEAI